MTRQLSPAELAFGGIAAMHGIHAIVEMASAAPHQEAVMAGRFRALVRMITDNNERRGVSGLRSALTRMLYVSAQTLGMPKQVQPGVVASPPRVEDSLNELSREQGPDVQRLLRMVADSRHLSNFVRAVGEGSSPSELAALGMTAAVVLREVLRVRVSNNDPMLRWVTLGQVTNSVMAAHYLQGTAARVPA